MAQRGGLRAGAGRPAGTKSKRTVEREAAVKEVAERLSEVMPDAFQGDAHALLMAVYKDPMQEMKLRVNAAATAIRYEKPSLSSVEMAGPDGGPVQLQRIERVIIDPAGSANSKIVA